MPLYFCCSYFLGKGCSHCCAHQTLHLTMVPHHIVAPTLTSYAINFFVFLGVDALFYFLMSTISCRLIMFLVFLDISLEHRDYRSYNHSSRYVPILHNVEFDESLLSFPDLSFLTISGVHPFVWYSVMVSWSYNLTSSNPKHSSVFVPTTCLSSVF